MTERGTIMTNPIAFAEYRHLYPQRLHQPWWRVTALATVALSLGITAVLFHLAATTDPFSLVFDDTYDRLRPLVALLLLVTLVNHLYVLAHTIQLAVNTIIPRSGTEWDSIVITGIDSRRLIAGKWWALVRLTWRDYLLVGLMRIGASLSLGTVVMSSSYAFTFYDTSLLPDPNPVPRMLIAALLVLALTLANCGFTAAAAVMGSLATRDNAPPFSTLFTARLSVIGVIILLPLPVMLAILDTTERSGYTPNVFMSVGWVSAVFIDNGTFATAGLAHPYADDPVIYASSSLIALIVYILLIPVLLTISRRIVRRRGILD